MVLNPDTLRWEGNDDELRAFDSIPTSFTARPALIPARGEDSIKIVGDMKFDPAKMCWVSTLDEEEVDPFEGMADDEDDDPGATITRASGRNLVTVGVGLGRLASESSASVWSMDGCDLALLRECNEAKTRHKVEMRGWMVKPGNEESSEEKERRGRKRLWEIWNQVMKA